MNVENSIPQDNRILYFARDRGAFGFMSHFHPSPIVLDGLSWASVEHFYQAQRSFDPEYRDVVRNAASAAMAKRLAAHPDLPRRASQKSWFRKNHQRPRPDWQEVKLDIMRRGDWAKFSQNEELGRLLLGTGSAELIEDSPFDPFWGIGPDGSGPNWAGRVLMEVRDRLRRGE